MSSNPSKLIHVETGFDTFDLNGYTCELSANSFVPPTRRTQPKERNFFNSHKETKPSSIYDQIFQIKYDFNPKAHRDDRQHSKFIGLNQSKEEEEKSYPSRSSSEYGRRFNQPIDINDRAHVRIGHVKNEFYRNNGGIDQKPIQL
ncbi:unnamed protein product [Rotaria magnacalcarata]|uniref:Uncharacterized protein n=1 Tax=Rotaria magnacalcarata TaxID=392030 RepID=A0A814XA25_9BILA|nr:unnamed protein product [Rotaria magnacalcarata]CAF1211361.1 unnamed protein product [Rotaria magnacalcarata]CAF1914152.1 unnamed protein product [Rotaria magnacalcarata]CAF1966492.1 unnamed protein product [Rotaria magnacalcarata]CAF2220530.1 unnamed protein product [Rotaria magnacalcarata]